MTPGRNMPSCVLLCYPAAVIVILILKVFPWPTSGLGTIVAFGVGTVALAELVYRIPVVRQWFARLDRARGIGPT